MATTPQQQRWPCPDSGPVKERATKLGSFKTRAPQRHPTVHCLESTSPPGFCQSVTRKGFGPERRGVSLASTPPSCLIWKPPGPPQSSSTNAPMKVDRLLLPRLVHLYGDTSKTKTPPSPQIRTEVGDKGPSGPPPWVACFIDEPNQPWHHASACGFELAEGSGKWAKGNSSSQHILFPCSEPSTRVRALSHSGCSHTPGESAPLVPCSQKQQLRFLRVRGFAKVLQLLGRSRMEPEAGLCLSLADQLPRGPRAMSGPPLL